MTKKNTDSGNALVTVDAKEVVPLFEHAITSVRDEMRDNPYIEEALRVLPVGGYRSAIGCFWNAVVDDLGNKIIHRSLELFNKSVTLGTKIKSYEDFQNYVNDDQLIEGAYKIGVIGWEASKVLKHAKETRHIFDGHPKSSNPSVIKVLAMVDDCVKYVLTDPYPPQIIDIDEYLTQLASESFDRNDIAVENALTELPEVYQNELVNRLYTAYVEGESSSVLRSNVEFAAPFLWRVLPAEVKRQVVRRVDQEIQSANTERTKQAFAFVTVVGGTQHLSAVARKYRLGPLVKELKDNLDNWSVENECVRDLEPYAGYIPKELLVDYVRALTMTYVGYTGSSYRFGRTDFYANGAAVRIPGMFEAFDDNAASAFVDAIRGNSVLRNRIASPAKIKRLRALGNIVLERVSAKFSERDFLEKLVDESQVEEFYKKL